MCKHFLNNNYNFIKNKRSSLLHKRKIVSTVGKECDGSLKFDVSEDVHKASLLFIKVNAMYLLDNEKNTSAINGNKFVFQEVEK